jgi:predicted Zn-dependent protease
MLIGKEGVKIASSVLNIFDDGIMNGGYTSAYDAERADRRTALVAEGVCQASFDTYWASREGLDRNTAGRLQVDPK